MAAGVSIDIGGLGLDHADVRAFRETMAQLRKRSGTSMKVALRRGTIAIIKSLREKKEGTKVAPKLVPRANVRLASEDPKYILSGTRRKVFVKHFNRAGKLVDREFFVPAISKTKRRRTKRRGIVEYQTEDRTKLLQYTRSTHGHVYNTGLARASWGWFMHALFGKVSGYADGAGGESGSRRVRIQRGRMVDGSISEKRARLADGSISLETPVMYTVDIVNKLSYIRNALYPGALERAIRKANNYIVGQLRNWDRIHGEK